MSGSQVLLVSAMRSAEYYRQSPRRRAAGDLGIRYLASALRAEGIRADILPDHLNEPGELERMLRASPDLVLAGFSLHTSTLEGGLASIALCRQVREDVRIAVGGYLPTFGAQAMLDAGVPFDFLLPGEAEVSLVTLACDLLAGGDGSGVPGVIAASQARREHRTDPTVRGRPPVLDSLTPPLRTRADMPLGCTEAMVSASRGCYGSCSFCSVPAFGRAGWRGRDAEAVAEEVAVLRRDFGMEFVDFVDDSLFGPRNGLERAVALRDALAASGPRIPFRASIRATDVDQERLAVLVECGLVAVQLGAETFSAPQLAEVYRKRTLPEDTLRAIRVLDDAGVHVQIGLILFEPGTTLGDLRANTEVLVEEPWAVAKSATSRLYAAEGTRLARSLVARGESAGVDGFLNHRWSFRDDAVAAVYEALLLREEAVGHLGATLVDTITPPCDLAAADEAQVRELQNRFQRASFRALELACDAVEAGASARAAAELVMRELRDEDDQVRRQCEPLLSITTANGARE